ncbi:prothrombin-like [Convolutriloba macropyga]|uniref:prothrombin-like n=1 Tax=Convolutriloba macropyga TaxID=536237 RepID=UPI003F526083
MKIYISLSLVIFSLVRDIAPYVFEGASTERLKNSLINNIINGKPTRTRDFAVLLRRTEGDEVFCGATIIDVYWAITAAHCVYNIPEAMFYLEYTKWKTSRRRTRVILRKFIHPRFEGSAEYRNDVALLRLKTKIADAQLREIPDLILPTCQESLNVLNMFNLGRPVLGFAGFGSISKSHKIRLNCPSETFFHESMFASVSTFSGIEFCREDNVCVDSVSVNDMVRKISIVYFK